MPLLAAIAAGLALLAIAVLVVLPKNAEAGRVADALAEERRTLAAMEDERVGLEEYRGSGRATTDLLAARALVPQTTAIADLITALDRAATTAGVSLSDLTPSAPAPATTAGLSVIPITVTASGPYFGLTRFMFELEHLVRLLRIDGFAMSSGEIGGTPSLSVTASVYTTDQSAGPGGDPAPGSELGA